MSTRTIIEINHDFCHDLDSDPMAMKKLMRRVTSTAADAKRWRLDIPGVRVLGQRHHSETLKLTIEFQGESGCEGYPAASPSTSKGVT